MRTALLLGMVLVVVGCGSADKDELPAVNPSTGVLAVNPTTAERMAAEFAENAPAAARRYEKKTITVSGSITEIKDDAFLWVALRPNVRCGFFPRQEKQTTRLKVGGKATIRGKFAQFDNDKNTILLLDCDVVD